MRIVSRFSPLTKKASFPLLTRAPLVPLSQIHSTNPDNYSKMSSQPPHPLLMIPGMAIKDIPRVERFWLIFFLR
jgi:hypothetical protein